MAISPNKDLVALTKGSIFISGKWGLKSYRTEVVTGVICGGAAGQFCGKYKRILRIYVSEHGVFCFAFKGSQLYCAKHHHIWHAFCLLVTLIKFLDEIEYQVMRYQVIVQIAWENGLKLIKQDLILNLKAGFWLKRSNKGWGRNKIDFDNNMFPISNIKLIWYSVMGLKKMQVPLKTTITTEKGIWNPYDYWLLKTALVAG